MICALSFWSVKRALGVVEVSLFDFIESLARVRVVAPLCSALTLSDVMLIARSSIESREPSKLKWSLILKLS